VPAWRAFVVFSVSVGENLSERRLRAVDVEEKPIIPRIEGNFRDKAVGADFLTTELQRRNATESANDGAETTHLARLPTKPTRETYVANRCSPDIVTVVHEFSIFHSAEGATWGFFERLPLAPAMRHDFPARSLCNRLFRQPPPAISRLRLFYSGGDAVSIKISWNVSRIPAITTEGFLRLL
jgi:hypothetical protein